MGPSTPTTPLLPPPCPRARQALATWGPQWPAQVPHPARAPEQKADVPQTARRHVSFSVSWVLAGRPRSCGSGGEGERRVLARTGFGMAAAGDRRATHELCLLPSITSQHRARWSLLAPRPTAAKTAVKLNSASLFKRQRFSALSLPQDNGHGPRKLAMNSWEVAVAAKIKYPLLLKNFFHLLRGKHIPHDFQKGAGLVYKYSTLIAL